MIIATRQSKTCHIVIKNIIECCIKPGRTVRCSTHLEIDSLSFAKAQISMTTITCGYQYKLTMSPPLGRIHLAKYHTAHSPRMKL